MSQIFAFHGTLYDQAAGDIRDVVAPPYDIIDAAGQQSLHERHPRNIIRLELGLDQAGDDSSQNRYTRAAATLRHWLNDGTFKQDGQPAVYYHTIEYLPPDSVPGQPTKVLRGSCEARSIGLRAHLSS
jgi:uncharacterized protein (DUF1015 family)